MDDALGVRWLDDGRLEVGVHIADVSHFVAQVHTPQTYPKESCQVSFCLCMALQRRRHFQNPQQED